MTQTLIWNYRYQCKIIILNLATTLTFFDLLLDQPMVLVGGIIQRGQTPLVTGEHLSGL
jgi:hypothetical protein